jgi:Thioredoxin-like
MDGSEQVAEAMTTAKKDNRHMLIHLGANSSKRCQQLQTLFETNKAIVDKLTSDHIVVPIGVEEGHNKVIDDTLGTPTQLGWPVIVIVDAGGKILTTKKCTELMNGGNFDADKVLEFLNQWAPKH